MNEVKTPMFSLKTLRAMKDMTQKEAGKAVGVSEYTWHNWEHFKSFPNAKNIADIQEAFGVSYDQIIFLPNTTVKP